MVPRRWCPRSPVSGIVGLVLVFTWAAPVRTAPADAAPPVDPGTPAALQIRVDALRRTVEELRGLKFVRDVPARLVDDAHVRDYLQGRLEERGRMDDLLALERLYRVLGLVTPDDDILGSLTAAIEEQVGGYYDTESGELFLLDDMPEALLDMIAVHELTHALDDQHFRLERRIVDAESSADASFAVGAVHEGSASLVMALYVARQVAAGAADLDAGLGALSQETIDSAPPVLLRQLIGPYVLGWSFVLRGDLTRMMRGTPTADLARVFEDGPRSSEQVLHPEKFWDPVQFDPPTEVRLPRLGRTVGRGFRKVATLDLGELTLALVVDPSPTANTESLLLGSPRDWTHPAAVGWDGDAWQLWSDGDRDVAVALTVWDDPDEAREFDEAVAGRHGWTTRRVDRRVAVAVGVEAERTERVLSKIVTASATVEAAGRTR